MYLQTRLTRDGQRGAALIVVTVVLVVILVGGLASIAVMNGQLDRARGYRTQETTEACARAGLQRIRAHLPTIPAPNDVTGSINLGGSLTYRAGHYDSTPSTTVQVLDPSMFDTASLYEGENIANALGAGGGGGGDLSNGMHVVKVNTVCEGDNFPATEVESIFRFGVTLGAR